MSTHKVVMPVTVTVVMEEMDGTPEESAEIAMNLVEEQIRDWDAEAEFSWGLVTTEEVPA